MLDEVVHECRRHRIPLLIAAANAIVEEDLMSAGLTAELGGPRFMFRRVHEAVRAVLLHEIAPDADAAQPPSTGTLPSTTESRDAWGSCMSMSRACAGAVCTTESVRAPAKLHLGDVTTTAALHISRLTRVQPRPAAAPRVAASVTASA